VDPRGCVDNIKKTRLRCLSPRANYSDRRLSAKLVPTFADRVSRGQSDGSLRPYSGISRPEPLLFLSNSSTVVLNEAERTSFQAHYFSENLVAPGIEPEPLDL
jgi:hypothetical protein